MINFFFCGTPFNACLMFRFCHFSEVSVRDVMKLRAVLISEARRCSAGLAVLWTHSRSTRHE